MATFTPSITSQRLLALRQERHLIQSEVATAVLINVKTLCDYERNKTEPSIETLKAFAKFFDVSLDYLLGLSDDRKPPIIIQKEELDDFQYALYGETKELTEEQKKDLLALVKIFRKNINPKDTK